MQNNVPDVAQELDRKVSAEVMRILHQVDIKRMTTVEAHARMSALWEMAAGLIPKDLMNILAQALGQLQDKLTQKNPPDNVAFFAGAPGGGLVITRRGGTVTVACQVGTHVTDKVKTAPDTEHQPEAWAFAEFGKTVLSYQQQGFKLSFLQ